MDIESLEFIFEDDPNRPQKRPIVHEEFVNELAFHEASHFVLGRLVNKLNLGFNDAVSIYIDSKVRKRGQVSGFGGDFNSEHEYWSNQNRKRFKEFYTDEPRRIWAESLVLIAGYASFKLFISDREDFISYLHSDESTQLAMHCLKTVPHHFWYTHANKYLSGVSDFAKIKERLLFIQTIKEHDLIKNYEKLLTVASDIMSVRAVECAIRFVKNKLIGADGEKIEGEPFKRIELFVDNLIKKVDISMMLKPLLSKPN